MTATLPPVLPARISPRLKRAAKIVLLAAGIFALYIFFHLHLDRFLSISSIKEHEAWVRERYAFAPLTTIAAYALFASLYVVCSLPAASIPMMIAGALFGLWLGTLISALALSLGAIVSLLLARFIFRDFVRQTFTKHAAIVEREYHRNGTEYLIALRLIPVMPYFLTNLAFGLTPIPVFRFWLVTLTASLPACFLFAAAGTELSKISSASDVLSVRLIVTLVALASLPFIVRRLMRLRRK